MARSWGSLPSKKVEAGSADITGDSLSTTVVRPENAVSRARLIANDYKGKNFIANIDALTTLKVSFRYGSDSWTQQFEGKVEEVGPFLTDDGWKLSALAYGYGRALRNTHCQESYGAESQNPTLETPKEIWDDLVDSHINKVYGSGVNTGYAITKTYINNITTPSVTHIANPYRKNLEIINEVCQLRQADQAGSAGVHWFVDPSKNLRIKTIGADQTGWAGWWDTDQATSTLTEGSDLLRFSFWKRTNEFANNIVLATQLRKPGYDTWTENKSGSWAGTNVNFGDVTVDSDTGALSTIVGTNFLEMTPSGIPCTAYYPSSIDSDWDFTSVGAPRDPPRLNFYSAVNDAAMTLNVRLFTTNTSNYYQLAISGDYPATKTWRFFSLPIGPYAAEAVASESHVLWSSVGAPNWNNIDAIGFRWTPAVGEPVEYVWLDDLHFSGSLIREASNSISSYDAHQLVIRMDTSVDDTMKASDDSGTAARLAYAELLLHDKIPLVGNIQTPGIVDILPGQKIHVKADEYSSGNYRVDSDFRVKQIIHTFEPLPLGFRTTLELTDDLINTFAKSPSDVFSTLKKAVFVDPEAKNLKSAGINPLVPRLLKGYAIND